VDVSSAVLSSVITEDRLIQQQQQQRLPVIFFTKPYKAGHKAAFTYDSM